MTLLRPMPGPVGDTLSDEHPHIRAITEMAIRIFMADSITDLTAFFLFAYALNYHLGQHLIDILVPKQMHGSFARSLQKLNQADIGAVMIISEP